MWGLLWNLNVILSETTSDSEIAQILKCSACLEEETSCALSLGLL